MTPRIGFYLFVMMGLAALTLALQPVGKSEAVSRIEQRECRFQNMQPRSWTEAEVRATIRCAAERWPVDLGTAMYVAERESGFRATATNPASGACGVWQFYPASSVGPRLQAFDRATGPRFDVHYRSCFNARGVTLWAIWYASRWGWGPWL